MEEGGDGAGERWTAALAEREAAEAEAAAAVAKAARAQKYDNMFSSVEALTATLMPCGKESHPELSIIGASEFQTHKRRCIHNDCANRIWRAGEACGFEGVFGAPCPTEMGDEPAEWRRWEKRLRGVNDEGKEFHALEWVPAHGNRKGLWSELLPAIVDTLPHMWSDDLMQQSVRVYEDRKSGRHLYELSKRRRVVTTPQLLADAMDVVVLWAEQRLEPPAVARPSGVSRQFVALTALRRLAEAAEKPPAAVVQQATQAAAKAQQIFDALSTTVTIQSDYASQLETSREFHATCATKERHNYLVTLLGYRSHQQTCPRPRKTQPRRRLVKPQVEPQDKPLGGRIQVTTEPLGGRSSRYPAAGDTRETVEFRQKVDGLFAFHKSGFKPNARSYNVVMEDVCHFLKFGTVLHGEWLIEGQRVPLARGSHRQPLPPGLSERPIMVPDFAEMARMEARTDGCPNQFDYGTNYHQTAEWRSKTAGWALGHAKARQAEAQASISETLAALQAAPSAAQSAAAEVLARAQAMGRKVAAETEDIVQSDGLAGAQLGSSNPAPRACATLTLTLTLTPTPTLTLTLTLTPTLTRCHYPCSYQADRVPRQGWLRLPRLCAQDGGQ